MARQSARLFYAITTLRRAGYCFCCREAGLSRLITCGGRRKPHGQSLAPCIFRFWCYRGEFFSRVGRPAVLRPEVDIFYLRGGGRSNDRPHTRRHASTRARVRAFTVLRLKTLKTFSCFSASSARASSSPSGSGGIGSAGFPGQERAADRLDAEQRGRPRSRAHARGANASTRGRTARVQAAPAEACLSRPEASTGHAMQRIPRAQRALACAARNIRLILAPGIQDGGKAASVLCSCESKKAP